MIRINRKATFIMIIDKKEAAIAYRCPACGLTVTSIVGVFSLSGDMIKLRCSCGESEMTMAYTPDKKIRLSVPCIACPRPHNYVIGQSTFFSRDDGAFRLPCSYTGIDICFIGGLESVGKAVEESNVELMRLMEEAGLDDLSRIRDDEEINVERDPQIEDIVRYTIAELNDEGKIKCECQNNAIARFDFRMERDSVVIFCEECDARVRIPMTGLTAAKDFAMSECLVLKSPTQY